jgi:hypothetical protein
MALGTDGRLYAWGSDSNGQLGTGAATTHPAPLPIESLARVVSVAASPERQYRHTLALDEDRRAWGWGSNISGQRRRISLDRSTPVRLQGESVTRLQPAEFTAWRCADGTAWAWGDNRNGQLGMATSSFHAVPGIECGGFGCRGVHALRPARPRAASGHGVPTTPGARGQHHDIEGTRWSLAGPSWPLRRASAYGGAQVRWRLGLGRKWLRAAWRRDVRHSPFGTVTGLSGVVAISAGGGHSLFLKSDGTVGGRQRRVGQLGDEARAAEPSRFALTAGRRGLHLGRTGSQSHQEADGTVVAGDRARRPGRRRNFLGAPRPFDRREENAAGAIATNDWF